MSNLEYNECLTCGNGVDSDGLSEMDTRWCTFLCDTCHGCEACDGGC